MSDDLMSLPLRELLKKFAAGTHKPGSGSAAALLALISASLSKTVIALTKDKPTYEKVKDELGQITEEISSEIEPLLEKAFEEDSRQFTTVIEARKDRDNAENHAEWWRRSHKALTELDAASHIALDIARASIRLTELAITVFDKGFKSARGDSEVAIEAAISGANGSISIVFLNLKDFRGESHAKTILDEAGRLATKAELLQSKVNDRMELLKKRAFEKNSALSLNAPKLLLNRTKKARYSNAELSQIARNVHSELWINREAIWPDADQLLPIQIIDPATSFRLHGYRFEEVASLGVERIEEENVEVAGFVDNEERIAKVSQNFPITVQRFTAAHELGHAILHEGKALFRDRGLDGVSLATQRPSVEKEADTFAAFFLMPELQVREIFRQIFGVDQFVPDRDSAFALGFQRLSSLKDRLPTSRHISTHLASVEFYAGRPRRSLSDIFGVSPTAMAIRIEELGLIQRASQFGGVS